MAMIREFDREFVERTLVLLQRLSEKTQYEVTLLLNLLLALVVLPIERENKENESDKMNKFQQDCVKKMEKLKNNKDYINTATKDLYFFRNIRNSIAHLHIKVEDSNQIGEKEPMINTIILKNYTDSPQNKNCNMKLNISVENLKIFAEYMAYEYLERFF